MWGGCHTHCLSIKHDYKLVTSSLSFFSPCCVFFLSFIFFLSRGQGTLLFGHLTRNCRHSHCPHISSNYAPYSDCLCASPSSPSSISPTMPRRANRPRFFPLFLIPHSNPECCTRKTPIKHSFRAKQIYKYFIKFDIIFTYKMYFENSYSIIFLHKHNKTTLALGEKTCILNVVNCTNAQLTIFIGCKYYIFVCFPF